MIIQLQPEQVTEFWPGIKEMLHEVERVNLASKEQLNQALKSILSGEYQCWVSFTGQREQRELHALCLTCIVSDALTGQSRLVVDSVYGYRVVSSELVREFVEIMRKFATASKCAYIVTMTNIPRAIHLLLGAGFVQGKTEYLLEV